METQLGSKRSRIRASCERSTVPIGHTEERFSDTRRLHGDLVDSLGRHGCSLVAVLCDGGLKLKSFYLAMEWSHIYTAKHRWSLWDRRTDAVCAQWERPSSLSRSSIAVRSHSDRWWSPMVAPSACLGRREVVVWASHWRRGRRGNAIELTMVASQSAVRALCGPHWSHTEGCLSDIRRSHGDLVDFVGRRGRSMVALLCDGGF